jgi:hypothetical protein
MKGIFQKMPSPHSVIISPVRGYLSLNGFWLQWSISKYEVRMTKYKVWDQPAAVRPSNFVLPTFVCTLYIVLRTFDGILIMT